VCRFPLPSDVQAAVTVLSRLTPSENACINLKGAWLHEVSLSEAKLIRANLAKAILTKAHLDGADLRHADLGGADLRGANLTSADLRGATFHREVEPIADFEETWPDEVRLIGARLARANLTKAKLRGVDLRGIDFHQATMTHRSLDSEQQGLLQDAEITWTDRESQFSRSVSLPSLRRRFRKTRDESIAHKAMEKPGSTPRD
jgi:hypothetical protein